METLLGNEVVTPVLVLPVLAVFVVTVSPVGVWGSVASQLQCYLAHVLSHVCPVSGFTELLVLVAARIVSEIVGL